MLPTDLLLNMGQPRSGDALFHAAGAIIWNLGTWFFGLPASISHTLNGANTRHRFNQRAVNRLIGNDALNLRELTKIFSSLTVSPMVGLVSAGGLIFLLRRY
ncbi:inorganic phosphate transporter [Shigella flexneri]